MILKLSLLIFFRIWLLTSTCLCAAIASPQIVSIGENQSEINLLKQIEWIVAKQPVQLSDVQNLSHWQTDIPTNQLLPDENLWGRITLSFSQNITQPYFLSVGNPTLNLVDIYILDDKSRILSSHLMGAERDYSKRKFPHRLFIIQIDDTQRTVQVFFKVYDDGPLVFPITLAKQSSVVLNEQVSLTVIGFINGGLSLLACYFLITYIFMRSPIRFWFSLSSAAFVVLFLNITGVLSQITGITAYISNITIAIIGALLFTSIKVAFAIVERIPSSWRYVFYLIGFCVLGIAFLPNNATQIIATLGLVLIATILIIVLASIYHRVDKRAANILASTGVSLVALSGITHVASFYIAFPLTQALILLLAFIIMLGLLIIALAIESHEKIISLRHNLKQQHTISDLQHFYELFRNSAEGLYTSTLDGQVISVNPAMCSLFGYKNETEMLENISSANQFYANPKDRDILLGEIHQHSKVIGKEIKGIKKDGCEFWFSISGQIKEENNQRYLFGSIFDITERKKSDLNLKHMASHDSLTGIFNRREFERRINNALLNAQKNTGELTVLYMDLDQFKVVNDTCGHKAGDRLLSQISQKIDKLVAENGLLARLGGDEFGVLLEGDNTQMAYLLANKILNLVNEFRFIWDKHIFTLGISIGQVSWQQNIVTSEQLLSMADSACYMAKERGRNQVHTYSHDDKHTQRYESELTWLGHINQALQDNNFALYYQHYQTLNKHDPGHHYEILLRMLNPDGELVPPATFLPSAERYNLTAQLDRWVIDNYFTWLAQHPEHQSALTRANINLSGHSLADKELKMFILSAFEKHKIPHNKVCFEITESVAILKMEETLEFINTFHNLGCKFALDDFGSGFSSYTYLKNLPVDQVKIDGSFVKDILIDPIDMAMVNSIKDVAKAMNIETIAEFVESTDIMVELGKMGVDYAQGYGIAKPAPLKSFSPL